jgi:signal transduction histidine kinase
MTAFPLPLLALIVGATVSLWLALVVSRRRVQPGSEAFVWLMVMVAIWSATSAMHWLADSLEAKVAWAKIQYIGIASVPALWLVFALEYAGVPWAQDRRVRGGLAAMGILTFVMALTNDWHHLVWPTIAMRPDGVAVYTHGAWFWLAATYHYAILIVASFTLVQAIRHSPQPFRGQLFAVLAGCLIPWALNVLYLSGWLTPAGFDTTPVGFAATGLVVGWALYRTHLFDLIPVARDLLVDSLRDAVFVLDPSGRVLDLNAEARRLAGDPKAWLGRPAAELTPLLKSLRFEETGNRPGLLGPVGDEELYYDLRVTGVRLAMGHYAAWLVMLRDVTEQRRAEIERQALEKRIQEQQRRESLSILAGGMAHDFNNLLTGIIGNADLLAMKVSPVSEMGSSVGAILLGAQRAADIVSKMLAYAGERHGASEQIDLDNVMRELLDLLQASVARHCTLHYDGSPVTILADPVQVRQVAMNLIINASEAVEEGTGVVDITVGSGELSSEAIAQVRYPEDIPAGTYAYLEVRDNGCGMDETTLAKIFDPFFTTKQGGHGLGLAAVQGIVRGHGGLLHVDSAPGQGTTFRVWFPQGRGPAAGQASAGASQVRSRKSERS